MLHCMHSSVLKGASISTLLIVLLFLAASPAGATESGPSVYAVRLHLENSLGTSGSGGTAGANDTIPYFPAASDALGRQGFARIVNLSDRAGTVSIVAFDDGGRRHGPVTLNLDAWQTVHFNSVDLEDGAASKGLPAGVGAPSQGDWRLELSSELAINVLSYIRTRDGFVTSMHDVASSEGNTHRVPFFNPGSNTAQVSLLRLVNPGDAAAAVTIRGVDDRGSASGGEVRLSIPAQAARTVSAMDLEDGAAGLDGSFGDGVGKWRLEVAADRPLMAIGMLSTPSGHLTNLSTDPGGAPAADHAPPAPTIEVTGDREFTFNWKWSFEAGETYAFDYGPRFNRGDWGEDCGNLSASTTGEDTVTVTYRTNADLTAGTVIEARYRFRNASSCDAGSPGPWSLTGSHTVPGLAPPDQASFDAHYVGKRVLTDDSAYSLDFVSAGRFQENLGDASYDGNYTYRYVGPDAAEVDLAYDDGDRCTWKVTFEQAASGTADFSCNDGTQGTTNWRVVDIPSAAGAPDMVVDSPSVSDTTPDAGASFSFSATVRNRGNGQSAATTLRYYRSSNSTISSGDTQVGNDAVGGLAASATSDETVTLTAPSSVGTYYYGACVDSVSGESSTSNNCSDGVKVDVSDGGGGGGGSRAGECVEGDTYDPGEGCDVYGTSGSSSNQRFSVLSNGRARFAFFEAGNSIDNRGGSINGVAYHFLASHQGNGVWKVDEYRP